MTEFVRIRTPIDHGQADDLFNADADMLQATQLRLRLFYSGASIGLTADEIEAALTAADSPSTLGHPYSLVLLWRLAEQPATTRHPVLRLAIESRVTDDYQNPPPPGVWFACYSD